MRAHSFSIRSNSFTGSDSFTRSDLVRLVLGVLVTISAVVAVGSVSGIADAAGNTVHVATNGDDRGSGTSSDPVRTIVRAVQLAGTGDTVSIGSGRYHEQVQVYAKAVHLRAAPGATVVLDGSSPIGSWNASGGRWSAPWTTEFARGGAPDTTAARPEAGWPEQVFIDGAGLVEVTSLDAVVSGTFYHDRAADRIWIADNPSGRLVEGSDLNWAIYLNRANGSSITGLTVQRYATTDDQMAAVRAYANDLTLDDLHVIDNARIGVSVIGSSVRLNEVTAERNGHLGIHANASNALTISDSLVSANNSAGFDAKHSAGGVKATSTQGVVVERSTVVDNGGPGIWTDLAVTDVVVRSNLVTGNGRSGIQIELSSAAVVIDNTVRDNGEAGIWVLESTDVDVWHNASYNNVRDVWVEEGPRHDVDDVTIFNNLLGGGSRPDGEGAILNVDDWTEQRSAASMNVRAGANRFWLVPGAKTTAISRWARWPSPLAISSTIASYRSATGQGAGSDLVVSASDPFSRSPSDTRQPTSASVGVALPADLAALVGGGAVRGPAGPLTGPGTTVGPPSTQPPPEDPDNAPGDAVAVDGMRPARRLGPQVVTTD